MQIDNNTVNKLAELAKLEFNEQEKTEIVNDLNRILTFIDKLNELDTANVEPLIYMTDERNVLRKDVVAHDLTHEEALLNAPKKDSDYFRVPKVLDNKG
jgi:aspartyl-tRNA(Asn)/glutamyl-tRNA(Gln) amidotransferase subunit C